ncbi:hypothetical protein [Kribbella sp. NPDC000426]|uniref:hypothetical protein n=1 Tax=Kribbella sp. NPDC000426 TaxID=3154255 RepID=UPI0033272D7B
MGQFTRYVEGTTRPPRILSRLLLLTLAGASVVGAVRHPTLDLVARAAILVVFAVLGMVPFAQDGRLDTWLEARQPLGHLMAFAVIGGSGFVFLSYFLSTVKSALIALAIGALATVAGLGRRRRT